MVGDLPAANTLLTAETGLACQQMANVGQHLAQMHDLPVCVP